jgi:hypothetical protein
MESYGHSPIRVFPLRSRLRLPSQKKRNATIANTTTPPTTPPAIAAVCDVEADFPPEVVAGPPVEVEDGEGVYCR